MITIAIATILAAGVILSSGKSFGDTRVEALITTVEVALSLLPSFAFWYGAGAAIDLSHFGTFFFLFVCWVPMGIGFIPTASVQAVCSFLTGGWLFDFRHSKGSFWAEQDGSMLTGGLSALGSIVGLLLGLLVQVCALISH